nr:hypothetical protein [bacterium]
ASDYTRTYGNIGFNNVDTFVNIVVYDKAGLEDSIYITMKSDTIGPDAVTLQQPADLAIDVLFDTVLNWSNAKTDNLSGFAGYILQVDTASAFASNVNYFTSDSSVKLTDVFVPTAGDTVYWRIISYDKVNNSSTTAIQSFVMIGDTAGPVIFGASPVGIITDNNPRISANYSDASGIDSTAVKIYINNILTTPSFIDNSNCYYDTTSNYPHGDSVYIRIISGDNAGNTSVYEWSFVPYYETLKVEILNPENEFDTISNLLIISGTADWVKQSDSIGIYVDGILSGTVPISVSGGGDTGVWQHIVNLTGIGNIVSVKLIDSYNTSAIDSITVNYFGGLSMKLIYPADLIDTLTNNIIVRGTSVNSDLGDSIKIYINSVLQYTGTISNINADWSGTATLTGCGDSLSAYLTDKFGRTASETITVNYYDAPALNISNPAVNGTDTNNQIITISGTTENTGFGDTLKIYCGGVLQYQSALSSLNGIWSGTVSLTGYASEVGVYVTDRFNRSAFDTRIVDYFGAPSIKISYPLNNADTMIQNVIVFGTAKNSDSGDSIRIYINQNVLNYTGTISGFNADWSGTAVLTGYGDIVSVYLTDRFGRETADTITVNYYGTSSVKITAPLNNHDTIIQNIIVFGTTENTGSGDNIKIYANKTIQYSGSLIGLNGSWSGTANLSGFGDSVSVYLTDRFGRTSSETITVNYFKTVDIAITSPENEYDTFYKNIVIRGTSLETKSGDVINVYVNGFLQTSYNLTSHNGDWFASINLTGQNDTVIVTILTNLGYYDASSIVVDYFDTPSISISSPLNNHDTNSPFVTISGTSYNTHQGDSLIISNGVYLNTVSVNSENGNWSGTIALTGKGTMISVTCIDAANRINTKTVTVNYYAVPSISITAPSVYTTVSENITVSGTSANSTAGDTIVIFRNGIEQSRTYADISGLWTGTASLTSANDSIYTVITDKFGQTGSAHIIMNYVNIVFDSSIYVIEDRTNNYVMNATINPLTAIWRITPDSVAGVYTSSITGNNLSITPVSDIANITVPVMLTMVYNMAYIDSQVVYLNFVNVNDTPSIVSNPSDTNYLLGGGQTYVYYLTVSDSDMFDNLRVTVSGMNITDSAIPLVMSSPVTAGAAPIVWSTSDTLPGLHSFVLRVTDAAGAYAEQIISVIIPSNVYNLTAKALQTGNDYYEISWVQMPDVNIKAYNVHLIDNYGQINLTPVKVIPAPADSTIIQMIWAPGQTEQKFT